VRDEVPTSLVDAMEFYLLNYFAPALERQTQATENGRHLLAQIGCTQCHVQDLTIERDRRVADVRTVFDATRSNGVFNHLFATATLRCGLVDDGSGLPPLQPPLGQSFVVRDVFADFRRHDLGPGFHERNFDGSLQTQFMTEPLWGVGSTPPYGHDGRSATLEDVILRHGGEAQVARDAFAALDDVQRGAVLAFLNTLILFGPPDTSSNLDPADPTHPSFPIAGHGSIDLSALFLAPGDKE
jgi:cytochrome c peroxidase